MQLESRTASRRMRGIAVHFVGNAAVAALACALVSCVEITGPVIKRTELQSLTFSNAAEVADSGAIVLSAYPKNIEFRLEPHQRIPVAVSTSAGDVERVMLLDEAGGQGTPWDGRFSRVAFRVDANPGATDALARRLRQRGLVPVPDGHYTNTFWAISFDPTRIMDAAEEVSRWKEVDFVSLEDGRYFTGGGTNGLAGPLRTALGSPRIGDGVLQFAPGDTLFARYVQPSGDALRASRLPQGATP